VKVHPFIEAARPEGGNVKRTSERLRQNGNTHILFRPRSAFCLSLTGKCQSRRVPGIVDFACCRLAAMLPFCALENQRGSTG
jgi:hypothetical protein